MEIPLLKYGFSSRNNLLAIKGNEDDVAVSAYYSLNTPAFSLIELERITDAEVVYHQIDQAVLEEKISTVYQAFNQQGSEAIDTLDEELDLDSLADQIQETDDLLNTQDDAPIIKLLNAILSEAINKSASDIHIESFEKQMSIRLRIDGVLQEVLRPGRHIAPLLVSRIKVMAKLDIAEKRLPQDGRVSLKIAGRALDVRISTIPSIYGERVVLRLLDKNLNHLRLDNLGMPSHTEAKFKRLLDEPNGIILVTGPTGSGKTTSLYAGLSQLNSKLKNILTVEDPIEYALDGIGQTQVNSKTGMTFSKGLRAILRQDPDIVMVGEIRDSETAQIAVQASLTGHLVLSTLHTNDSVGAITRLIDIGVEPFLLASTLQGVLAQRLVRKLCSDCKSVEALSSNDAQLLGDPSLQGKSIYRAVGCNQCNHTGYVGRLGIYELLEVDDELRKMIHSNCAEHEIADAAQNRLLTMIDEGQRLVIEGVTSVEEVLRVVKGVNNHAIV